MALGAGFIASFELLSIPIFTKMASAAIGRTVNAFEGPISSAVVEGDGCPSIVVVTFGAAVHRAERLIHISLVNIVVASDAALRFEGEIPPLFLAGLVARKARRGEVCAFVGVVRFLVIR